MSEYQHNTDHVGLNAPGSSGSVVATDYFDVHGSGVSAHVQYIKMGWGGTNDVFYTVGDDFNAVTKPLPVMLRSNSDGAALSNTSNVLDIHHKSHGITLHVDVGHRALSPALFVQGTAGMVGLAVQGTSGAAPVYIAATGGTANRVAPNETLSSMLFGVSMGGSGVTHASPVGVTKDRLMVYLPDKVNVNASNITPLFISVTGGMSASSGSNAKISLESSMPSLMLGLSGPSAAPIGMSADMLKVFIGQTAEVFQTLTGTAEAVTGLKTQPVLLYGQTGPDSQAITVTGGRMRVDLAGETVKIDHDHGGIYVRATAGLSAPNNGNNTFPMMLFGLCGGAGGAVDAASKMAVPVGVTNGRLDVHLGSSCLTVEVSVTPFLPVLNATSDSSNAAGSIHNRYLHVAGPTSHSGNFKHGELHPVFVSGKSDGSTYSYPIGITTSMVGASGGAWALQVTGETEIKKWSAGALTVSATNFDVRGLTAKGGKDIVGVEGVSHGLPVLIQITGGMSSSAAPMVLNQTAPSLIMGITNVATNASGLSAAAIGMSSDALKVYSIAGGPSAGRNSVDVYGVMGAGIAGCTEDYYWTNTLMMGVSGASAYGVGLSGGGADAGGSMKVYDVMGRSAGRDSISMYAAGGVLGVCGAANNSVHNTVPMLMMGISSGGSAAPVGMSGDALNVNLINAGVTVDVTVGTHVEVSNDYGAPLYVAGSSAGGACGGQAPYPVSVASDYLGHPVAIGGSAGMTPVEVRGSSASTYYPVGITSGCGDDLGGNNWAMASDQALIGTSNELSTYGIGGTLDNIYNIIANGLGDDSSVGTPNFKFATEETMSAMKPNGGSEPGRIASASQMSFVMSYLQNISNAVVEGETSTVQMQVDIVSFPQPDAFVQGQQTATSSQGQLNSGTAFGLSSGVKVKGHQNNSEYIFIGKDNTVSAETGYPLGPSEEIFLEIDDVNKVWIFASPNGTACFIGS